MNDTSPSLEQWERLYQLMGELKQLAPWTWMHENDIFGIQPSGEKEPDFISVMGALGEHLAIAVYLGFKGLGMFWQMQEQGPRLTPEFALQVPQLQASFEDREQLTDEDRKIIKRLGLKFRGAKAWPQFRSYRPGYFPWYLEQWEANLLIHALEQTLTVAPRFRENPAIFNPTERNDEYLVRVKQGEVWMDAVHRINTWVEGPSHINMDRQAVARLKAMPGKAVIEAGVFMLSSPIQEKRNARPYFPFMLMMVEQQSGYILAGELLTPLPSLDEMWADVPAIAGRVLAKSLAPKELQVSDEKLFRILTPLAEEAGFRLTKVKRLRALESAQRGLKRLWKMAF